MRIAVVVMLVGVLFAPQTPSRAATASDTLVYVNDISDMISLDPAVAYEFSGVLVAQNAYDARVTFEGEDLTTIKPRLAQSWTIRDAGLTWKVTFKLRPGVKFSTGRPVTAKAVAFSFDRVIALNKSPAFLFKEVAGLNEGDTIPVGDDTVVVSLPKTASPLAFLNILTFTVGAIVDPDEAMAHQSGADRGEAWLRNHSAGAGPYVLERWDPQSRAVLVANPNYWGPKPRLSRIIIQHVPETSTQKFMLETGDADIAADLTPEQAQDMASKPDVKLQDGKLLQLVYVGMNVKQPPLDNVKVREAIRWSIDYDGIIRSLLRGGARKVQMVMILWGPDFPDPDGNATPFSDYAAHSIAWRNQYNDMAAAALAKQAALEPDLTKRRNLYKQLTDKVLHEGPYIVLYQPTKRFGLRQNVQGFVWNPMAYTEFRTVSK